MALEVMLDVLGRPGSTFLDTEHTLRHYRSSLWLPKLLDRRGWEGAEWEARLLQRAGEEFQKLLAEYKEPKANEEGVARMRKAGGRGEEKNFWNEGVSVRPWPSWLCWAGSR